MSVKWRRLSIQNFDVYQAYIMELKASFNFYL